ncbi:MAG: hypothetical protein GEU93_16485 [Propionibacteriales bacterium]|nr:hypothetical protein [Propionibacteriales bacterium]
MTATAVDRGSAGWVLRPAVEDLVGRVSGLTWDRLDEPTRAATRALVLDALGLAAAAPAAPSLAATSLALRRVAGSAGHSGVHVPFAGAFPGPGEAATALSVAVHAWDFDDTHDDAVVHAACVAVPAALAVAQECGADGRRMLEGVVAGVEILCRLSLALGPQAGVIRTAGLGGLGAAAAAARVLGLPADRTLAALALALPTALAPTSRQVVSDSAINKRHQPGLAVHAGVTAAYLAAAGLDGPAGWWDGEHGLARAVGDLETAARSLDVAGWEVARVSLKPYPACRYAHAAVAGVLDLTRGEKVAAEEAPSVEVHLPVGSAHVMVARPFERRGQPIVDAQFSVPWLVAAALLRGGVGLPEMTDEVRTDPAIERVAQDRVTVVQDQDPGTGVMTPVVVRSTGPDGVHSVTVKHLPGSPARRLTREEQRAKLLGCLAVAGRPAAEADTLAALVADLDSLSPRELTQRLPAATPEVLHA